MRKFFNTVVLIATFLSLDSCTTINGTLLGTYEPIKNITTDLDYEKTWEKIVDLFAELAIPISVIDKESGIITSNEAVFGPDVVTMEFKYGHIFPDPDKWFVVPYNNRAWGYGAKCMFNIRLKKTDNGKTNVQVYFHNLIGNYEYRSIQDNNKYPIGCKCKSTGEFEKLLMQWLQQ